MKPAAGERPILFSGPMVRAILAGKKTQTRRILQMRDAGQRLGIEYHADVHMWAQRAYGAWDGGCWSDGGPATMVAGIRCPYGQPSDTLWVRETWQSLAFGREFGVEVHYAADGYDPATDYERRAACRRVIDPCPDKDNRFRPVSFGKWRPSIFMPRWASRLTLRITSVRVERLQDISEADAKAEGVLPFFEQFTAIGRDQRVGGRLCADHPHWASFVCLWDEINGDRGAWASNPWVWVVTFERVGGPS